jgi:hypothetical protein
VPRDLTTAPEEPPDLRLVLPAVAVWVVAWQARLLPVRLVLVGALVLALAGPAVLLRWRGRTGGLLVASVLLLASAAAVSTAARVHTRTSGPLP